MEHLSHNKRTTVATDRARAAERIVAFLRTRYPYKMAENVAADIAVSVAAVRKLEERGSAPSLAVSHPTIVDYDCEVLATEAGYANNQFIAMIEDCHNGDGIAYPCAINAKNGNLERGGPMRPDRAKAWAERVAGLHPTKPSDERPPFYHAGEERS